jgi:hypothetical protein
LIVASVLASTGSGHCSVSAATAGFIAAIMASENASKRFMRGEGSGAKGCGW